MQPEAGKPRTLHFGTVYKYGMGEFGFTFFNSLVAYYLLYYMTDIALIPMAVAGVLYSALQWVEALTSIGAGVLIDNTRLKGGRYRPWLLIGSIVCALGTVVFFTRFHVSTTATTVIFAVFYFVSYAGFNCMWIAYRALLGIIGRTSQQTVALTISGTQLSTVASLFYSYLGVKMLTAFPSAETGYTVSALVYGAIMVGSMVLVFFIARPYDVEHQPQQEEGDKPAPQEKVTVRDMLRALPPILPFAISYILSIGASTLLFSCLVYYFNYSVGDPAKMSVLLTEMTIVRFAATFVVRWLSGKLDKKYIYMCGVGLAAICSLLAYFLRANMLLFFICMGAYFFVLVPAGAMFMPCVADATDYNEYKRGIRARSFTYSVASTLMYIAQVVGASCASYGLVKIGYDASLAAQPASVTHGIAVVTLLGTALLTALSILPMFFYKLDRHTMQPIYDLKEAPAAEGERANS